MNFATSGTEHDSKHYGGEPLSHCTSGFPVVNSSGTRGIVTAGHCYNDITDDGDTLTWKGQHIGIHGDIQWHTGPETVSNKFYSGRANASEVHLRSVIKTNTPVYNQRLCRNGKTSNRDCQRVRKVDVCAGSLCNLGQIYAHLSAGGDSGGPVFSSNTAYGVHQGVTYEPPNSTAREVFTRLDEMYDAIEVDILTDR